MMRNYRSNPPKKINNNNVLRISDYETLTTAVALQVRRPIKLQKSDVLQFFLEDGSKISIGLPALNRKSNSISV